MENKTYTASDGSEWEVSHFNTARGEGFDVSTGDHDAGPWRLWEDDYARAIDYIETWLENNDTVDPYCARLEAGQ